MSQLGLEHKSHSILLIVEDRLLAEDLGENLGKFGYDVMVASVSAALAPGFSAAIDLIVIDTDIAGVEQAEALETGKQIRRRLGRPIVYLIDDADQVSQADKKDDGSHFVIWPFPPAALQGTLQRALLDAVQSLPN